MKPITLKHQLAAAQRELALRRRAYPKWIAAKRMNPHVAEHELAAMAAIVASLEKLVGLEETSEAMLKAWRKDHPPDEPVKVEE